jgi:hypothetical protein
VYDSEMVMQEAFSSRNKLKGELTKNLNRSQISELTDEIKDYDNFRHNFISNDASYFEPETLSYHRNFKRLNDGNTSKIMLNKVATWFANRIKAKNDYAPDGQNVFFRVSNNIGISSNELKYFNADANIEENYIFPLNKLTNIFDYSYDKSVGVVRQINREMNVKDFNLNDFDEINLDFSNTALDSMDIIGNRPGNYAIGEIYPNYRLIAKVAKVDLETNSHYAYLDIELGIQDSSVPENTSNPEKEV